MLNHICYFFIYLFEVMACFVYLENRYSQKCNNRKKYLGYLAIYLFQYIVNFFSVPGLNMIVFALSIVFIILFVYNATIKSGIFTSLMLTVFMLITEMIVVYFSSSVFHIDLTAFANDIIVLVTQSSISKLLFFIVIFIISKIMSKRKQEQDSNKFIAILGILPITSIVILYALTYFEIKYSPTSPYNTVLTVCSILLLFSNILVFYIYDLVQKTNYKYTQLSLEQQKEKMTGEYYELLQSEYENSQILIHDIKRHLMQIEGLAASNENGDISKYVNTVCEDFGLNDRIKYSGNKMVDVIINRYVKYCKENGLTIEVDAHCPPLDFMSDCDITSLFDNLLNNAVEAAENSTQKMIDFSVVLRNSNFIIIKIKNSCDTEPQIIDNRFISTKQDEMTHGIGTKSIKRIVSKHSGDITWNYDKLSLTFEISIVLKTTK